MKRFYLICLCLIHLVMVCGQKSDKNRDFTGDQIEFIVKKPLTEENVSLMAEVPKGWKVNPNFGTVVYQPGNSDDYYEPPLIEFQARCEGECKTEAIPGNIDGYIQRLKVGWKQLSTGDEELDKLGANVEILIEEKLKGQVMFEVKLTYPDGVSSSMYPPRHYIYRFLYADQDSYFILIKGIVPESLADEFLTEVRSSCVSTVKL